MAKATVRDKMWTVAMKRTHRDGNAITAPKLSKMTGASERSARDCLKTMAENGVLRAEVKGNGARYVPEWESYE